LLLLLNSVCGKGGQTTAADQFNPARQRPWTFFQAPGFRLWTAVQQHWLLPVPCWLVCRSST